MPVKNNGTVIFDSPDRRQPYAQQMTVGYARQIARSLALHADYIRMMNKDMFLARNLNPAVRVDTSRTGALTRFDAFGVLGEPYRQQVWVMENDGESEYDGLNAVDVNRNDELDDPVPAGTYSGTKPDSLQNVKFNGRWNGARGPDYFQTDVRAGWHGHVHGDNTLEVFLDIFNLTNRTNFENPINANRDMRLADFLVKTNLYGGGGFPRQAQLGMRLAF